MTQLLKYFLSPNPHFVFVSQDVPNFKVICCGGDGTVGWVLENMDRAQLENQPAVGVIPLGTGNDLARCLRWGGGYEGESVHKLLHKIARSSIVMMDRWSVELTDVQDFEDCKDKESGIDKIPYNIINNYLSVGVVSSFCIFLKGLYHTLIANRNMELVKIIYLH